MFGGGWRCLALADQVLLSGGFEFGGWHVCVYAIAALSCSQKANRLKFLQETQEKNKTEFDTKTSASSQQVLDVMHFYGNGRSDKCNLFQT